MANKLRSRTSGEKSAESLTQVKQDADGENRQGEDAAGPQQFGDGMVHLPFSGAWRQWVRYLSARRNPASPGELARPFRTHPLQWSLPRGDEALTELTLLKQLSDLGAGKRFVSQELASGLHSWLNDVPNRSPGAGLALECIASAHALPRLASILSEAQWRELLQQLEDIAKEAGGIKLDADPVAHQLLHGELPLVLSYQLPEIDHYRSLAQCAVSALSLGAWELTDGEGSVHARHLVVSRDLLACWTRCGMLASAAGYDCFDEQARIQYEWAVRQALWWSRSDGSLVLGGGRTGEKCPDLFRAAIAQGGDGGDKAIGHLVWPGNGQQAPASRTRDLPSPANCSEWAEACVMRSTWKRKSPQFACLFDNQELRTELSVREELIWSGAANPALSVDGKPLRIASEWSELCWFTDEDVHYLELEAEFDSGWTVQRQMLLARRDDFLLVADAVLGPRSGDIAYQAEWPIAEDIEFLGEEATHDGYLKKVRPLCTVLPLALPEWRAAGPNGRLEMQADKLRFTLNKSAQRLYAPLFFDLASRRWTAKRTWRQLTVAERRMIQPAEVAAGYRVQIGRKQWLIYRSLGPVKNRTLLGQNLCHEFVVGQFHQDGSLTELIEIE